MPLYRKKQFTAATQWNKPGDHPAVMDIPPGLPSMALPPDTDVTLCGFIRTREGGLVVVPGAYICGPDDAGFYWPVAQSQFEASYELVEEEEEPETSPSPKPSSTTRRSTRKS